MSSPTMHSILLAWCIASLSLINFVKAEPHQITDVVLLGDSYTDQSRLATLLNGTWPGKNYQQIYPPEVISGSGGFQWPFYLGLYGNYTIHNYAVGGAVCAHALTPLEGAPDVSTAQKDWFVEDHVVNPGTSSQQLLLDPESFVVIMFVGTNDVGFNSFVTNDNRPNVSLVDVADCQMDSIRRLHALGARQFILNSLAPLQLTPLYSGSDDATIMYPAHNGTAWHRSMYNLVGSLNRMLLDGARALNEEWRGDGHIAWFNTYDFFQEIYDHPAQYFNGSIPANVTGHCRQCSDPNDPKTCDDGVCPLEERDSYMWYDELHPSEQTGRNLAAEMHKKILGTSKY